MHLRAELAGVANFQLTDQLSDTGRQIRQLVLGKLRTEAAIQASAARQPEHPHRPAGTVDEPKNHFTLLAGNAIGEFQFRVGNVQQEGGNDLRRGIGR